MSKSPYNPGIPELAEIPKIEALDTDTKRLTAAFSKRLPSMPGGQLQDLYGTTYRAEMQAKEAAEIGYVNDITKKYNQRSAARARAKNRMGQKAAERAPRNAYQTNRNLVSMNKRREKDITRYFARNVFGMGTDLYR